LRRVERFVASEPSKARNPASAAQSSTQKAFKKTDKRCRNVADALSLDRRRKGARHSSHTGRHSVEYAHYNASRPQKQASSRLFSLLFFNFFRFFVSRR